MPRRGFLSVLLIAVGSALLGTSLGSMVSSLSAQMHQHQSPASGVCRGFVILPNGFAVLSGTPMADGHGSHGGHGGHGAGHGPMHGSGAMPAPGKGADHLLGHHHGQDIVPQPGMLCVAVGAPQAMEWTASSSDATLLVKATSLKGPLAHNSRANEAFNFTIARAGAPIEQAQVRLLVRMPNHDRRMPGGHGPANDPDVKGLAAQPDGPGRYTVQSVDFSMVGSWLLEFHIQEGANTHKAYLGVAVGEE